MTNRPNRVFNSHLPPILSTQGLLDRGGQTAPADVGGRDTDELLHRIQAGDTVVLDVRPAAEYAGGHRLAPYTSRSTG